MYKIQVLSSGENSGTNSKVLKTALKVEKGGKSGEVAQSMECLPLSLGDECGLPEPM